MNKRYLFIFILSILSTIVVKGQSKIALDTACFSLKDSLSSKWDIDRVVDYIQSNCENEVQKLSLVSGWIYDHMDFDIQQFRKGSVAKSITEILEERKGTCQEYANLFSAFCKALGIRSFVIEGYVKPIDYIGGPLSEINHAWNVVAVEGRWYHCDLQSFSGRLNISTLGEYVFEKEPDETNFLTQERSFIAKRIPADPIWQLSNYPIAMDSLLVYGNQAQHDSSGVAMDFSKEIEHYINATAIDKKLLFADHAFTYNNHNHNIIVVNYYNAAVRIIRYAGKDKKKLLKARKLLLKSKAHIKHDINGVKVLEKEIEKALRVIDQRLQG